MRMKKLLVAFLALAMLATGSIGNTTRIKAATGDSIIITEDVDLVVKPGETTHIKLPIKAVGTYVLNPTIEIEVDKDAPFTITKPTLSVSKYPVSSISTSETTHLEFDVKVKETAVIKNYPIKIKFTCDDPNFDENDYSYTLNTSINVLEEKVPAQLTISNVVLGNTNVANNTELYFTVKNEGEVTARNIYLVMNYGGFIEKRYTADKIKIVDLKSGATEKITLPITIPSNAGTGRKTLIADFTYKTVDGDEVKSSYNINVNLVSNDSAPKLDIADVQYKDGLKPGDDFNLSVALNNVGAATASDITVMIDPTSINKDGILKDYFTDGIQAYDIKRSAKRTVDIPLTVSKYATGGLKELKIIVSYTDEAGLVFSSTNTVYVDVAGEGTGGSPNIIVSGVKQSPAQPVAGEKVVVSFYLENKSNVDITELKIKYAEFLTGTTFIPVETEPYQYIEKLKGGTKTLITIPLIVADSITEGPNSLTVNFTYSTNTEGDTVKIPISNVQNDLGSSSTPKLIVSKYITDVEELRAGSVFDFTFDIYNTNSSVAAKNITVTVTQLDNMFTVTQGSNSFFINKIQAGETVQNTLEMKVKSDASTKAYPLKIVIEYEYDGIKPNPETGKTGETKTEELNLQAVENSRPVVDYVNVYSWDGNVTVGNTATLAFEFYNMGRSPLNNVIATVEGDFTKADGNMYFIGNVAEGSSTYAEFEVIPNLEGTAKGTLKITFEDSNGDEVEFIKEFEAPVLAAGMIDPGMVDGGTGEVFNPELPMAKKAILPIWLFIILQIVIFAVFLPVTRKIIISIYKSKLRKKELEQY